MFYQQPTRLLSIGQASQLLGVSVQSMRNWDSQGKLVPITLPSGHRRYSESDIRGMMNGEKEESKKTAQRVVIVSRVSSLKQENKDGSLTSQTEELKAIALSEYGCKNPLILSQVASGQNLDRRQLIQLLELSFSGQLKGSVVLCTYRDRLGRSCVSLIKRVIELGGATLRIVHPDESKEELTELLDDIKSLFCLYNARTLGKRGGKKNIRSVAPHILEKIVSLHKAGIADRAIVERLRGKYSDENGRIIGKNSIKRILNNPEIKELFGDSDSNSFKRFRDEVLNSGNFNDGSIPVKQLWIKYRDFCDNNNLEKIHPKFFHRELKKVSLSGN